MGTKVGTQKVQDDLMRQNRILERRIKALEFALKAERFLHYGDNIDCRAKNSGKEVAEESNDVQESPTPSSTSQAIENGTRLASKGQLLITVNTDITPLLTHPDRQRSRKLLESCLREINYLMTPPTIPIDQNTNQDWQLRKPPPPIQQQLQQPPPPPRQPDQAQSEEISYVSVDNSEKPSEDEELPRKLPRKVTLATDTPGH